MSILFVSKHRQLSPQLLQTRPCGDFPPAPAIPAPHCAISQQRGAPSDAGTDGGRDGFVGFFPLSSDSHGFENPAGCLSDFPRFYYISVSFLGLAPGAAGSLS